MPGNNCNYAALIWLTAAVLTPVGLAGGEVEPPPMVEKMTERERAVAIATYERLIAHTTPVRVGDTEADLLGRLGEPEGSLTMGQRKRLGYDAGFAMVENGRIVQLSGIPKERLCAPDLASYEAYQRARGMVHYLGRWMTAGESQAVYQKALQDQERSKARISKGKAEVAARAQQINKDEKPYLDIRQRGNRIRLADLLVPGRITVIDFYADWCGPCKQIAPYLAKLSEAPDVVVRKVDIVNWNSPVAKQYELRSIPNMRVYDDEGRAVGNPTHDLRQVIEYIQQARH